MWAPAVADRRFAGKRQVSSAYNLPAPTGGLNAKDAFTEMKPTDAVTLTNVFPEANNCVVRGGSTAWATGLTNPIHTLMTWFSQTTAADKLFAAETENIWDVTASGAGTKVVDSLTNPDWQSVNTTNSGGSYLIAVNGADAPQAYDGSSWSTPSITGVTASTFIGVISFKQRLWFIPVNSLSLWYLGTQAIAGEANEFPLGAVFRRGGYIMAGGSFSYDAGEGADDYLAIITSNGEIAVYQGTDPTSNTTWSLVGVFTAGRPIGRRCVLSLNGDLIFVTQDGALSMLALLKFGRASDQKASISAKIRSLFSKSAIAYGGNFGWQPLLYPKGRYLIVNVPVIADMVQTQMVMNTVSGAWCTFAALNAGCWGVASDNLYFGGNDGKVYQANVGFKDSGSAVYWEVQAAWQMPGGAANKMFKMVRPVMLTGSGVSAAIGVDVDFLVQTPGGATLSAPVSGSTWPWTWPGAWSGSNNLDAQWRSVGAIGTWASVHVVGSSSGGSCQINGFDLVAEKGGVL